jgi:uncharacterized protein
LTPGARCIPLPLPNSPEVARLTRPGPGARTNVFMRALAGLIVRKSVAWGIVAAVLVLAVVSPILASRLENDSNLLAFLPETNPDVSAFSDINKRFGGLNVALVGIGSDDPLSADFLGRMKGLTRKLNQTQGIDYALGLTSVEDFAPDPKGGIASGYLVSDIPTTPEGLQALREKVMSRDQVVGNMISADAKAAMILCFLTPGSDPKPIASVVRSAVEEAFPKEPKYWGGAPFIQSYIYSATEADLRKLTPWACLAIIVIAIASFRDAIGSFLALFSTGVGIMVALAIMAVLKVKANLVLGSMPVILFALGSAYPIHLLTRYYTIADDMGCEKALTHTLTNLGPTILATGFVTISGLLSFLSMDMEPMRTFGLFTAIGVFVTLVLAVTFVPAVVRIINLKGKRSIERPTGKLMVSFCTLAQERRTMVGIALGVVAVAGGLFISRLDSRIDNAAFYAKTSPPAQAEAFMRDHFGGSQFFQINVDGDMTDPAVLRELRHLGDEVALVPHVSSVQHVGDVVAKINEAMDGDERIPNNPAGVKLLYGFLKGKKAVSQLLTEDHEHALMQVKVDTDRAAELEDLLEQVQGVVDRQLPSRYAVEEALGPKRAEVEARLALLLRARAKALGRRFGVPIGDAEADALAKRGGDAVDPVPVKAALAAYMKSEEFIGDIPASPPDAVDRIADALSRLPAPATEEALLAAIGKAIDKPAGDATVSDLASSLGKTLDQTQRRALTLGVMKQRAAALKLAVPEGPRGQRFLAALANGLMELDAPTALLPLAGDGPGPKLRAQVTGLPVLNRGLSRSVRHNQIESLVVAMVLVFAIALFLYRSPWSALLALSPMVLTLLVVYGGMGLLGVRLDIGTSMLASLSIGAGVDYAVHLLAAWKAPEKGTLKDAAGYSSLLVGRAIWTNAVMVAAGFVVLTMGEAKPLQNVGGLTAAAMIAAAMATFAVIPVLARRLKYDDRPRIHGVDPSSNPPAAPYTQKAA